MVNERTFTTVALLVFAAIAVLIATRCEPSAAAPRSEPRSPRSETLSPRSEPLSLPRVALPTHLHGHLPAGATLLRCIPVDGDPEATREVTPEADGSFGIDLPPGRWRVESWRGTQPIDRAELQLSAGMTAQWPR